MKLPNLTGISLESFPWVGRPYSTYARRVVQEFIDQVGSQPEAVDKLHKRMGVNERIATDVIYGNEEPFHVLVHSMRLWLESHYHRIKRYRAERQLKALGLSLEEGESECLSQVGS